MNRLRCNAASVIAVCLICCIPDRSVIAQTTHIKGELAGVGPMGIVVDVDGRQVPVRANRETTIDITSKGDSAFIVPGRVVLVTGYLVQSPSNGALRRGGNRWGRRDAERSVRTQLRLCFWRALSLKTARISDHLLWSIPNAFAAATITDNDRLDLVASVIVDFEVPITVIG